MVLQMNSDPRLEFGMNTPKVQEMAAPDMKEVLQAAREPMRRIMGVESDEDWQVRNPNLHLAQTLICSEALDRPGDHMLGGDAVSMLTEHQLSNTLVHPAMHCVSWNLLVHIPASGCNLLPSVDPKVAAHPVVPHCHVLLQNAVTKELS